MAKNIKKWEDIEMDEWAYIPENIEEGEGDTFNKATLIAECNGKEETAKALFGLLEWQYPSTLLEEWLCEGEIDLDFNLIN